MEHAPCLRNGITLQGDTPFICLQGRLAHQFWYGCSNTGARGAPYRTTCLMVCSLIMQLGKNQMSLIQRPALYCNPFVVEQADHAPHRCWC